MEAAELYLITLTEIQAAQARIAPRIRRTGLVRSATLSQRLGANVYLKLELLQKTGSFKIRGAFNKMLALPSGSRAVAVSGGNHGQAVAYAGGVLGLPTRVIMPRATPQNYLAATRGYGAELLLADSIAEAFARAAEAEADGWTMVHPFDDAAVIAGQGTLGLELLEDLPELTDVVVSIGGGGLAAGVAIAVKQSKPAARIWGVETEGADCMSQALAAGRIITLEKNTSIARTLGAPAASGLTLAAAQKYLERVEVVTDGEAVRALNFLLERAKLLTEPAAACTLAAAERLAPNFKPTDHVVLVLCGGNVGVADLCGCQSLAQQ